MLLALVSLALAVPPHLPQQGRILDSGGVPLTGAHSVDFVLYDGPGGTALWTETRSVAFDDGYYSVDLGDSTPIDDADLDQSDLWLGVTVDGGTESQIRVGAVPFARLAGVARSVNGGVVDASEVQIDGTTVIDSSGTFQGTVTDTLSSLGCAANQVAVYQGSTWICGTMPADTDTTLTGAEVDAFVTDGPLDLAAGTTLDGAVIATGPHTVDTTLSGAEVDAFVVDGPLDLAAGTTVGGQPIGGGGGGGGPGWTVAAESGDHTVPASANGTLYYLDVAGTSSLPDLGSVAPGATFAFKAGPGAADHVVEAQVGQFLDGEGAASLGPNAVLVLVAGPSGWIVLQSSGVTLEPVFHTGITYTQSNVYAGTLAADETIMNDEVYSGTSGTGTNNGADEWVQADLGSDISVRRVRVAGGGLTGWGGVAPYLNGREVQASTDGTNWNTVFTIAGVVDTGGGQAVDFTFAPTVARYWRIHHNGWVAVMDFRLGP